MFALDTTTLIYFFKGVGRIGDHLLANPPSQIMVPSIVLFELEVGIAKSKSPTKRRIQLGEFLSVVTVQSFGPVEARTAAMIRADLEKRGKPIGPLDTLIAATALAHKAVLVTHNTREFKRIPRLEVVDWY
jgi:tRNA(fMet)-specific endonuclease VapC